MKIINKTKNTLLAQKAAVADTFWTRMVGLLNRDSLAPDEALLITRCQSIHMLFMRFPIDVVFVSKGHKVVGLQQGIKPFRLSPIYFKASFAIELATGAIARSTTALGDQIEIDGNG